MRSVNFIRSAADLISGEVTAISVVSTATGLLPPFSSAAEARSAGSAKSATANIGTRIRFTFVFS